MISSYLWTFRLFARRLWVRACLISALAILAAALAPLSAMLPLGLQVKIKEDDLSTLLDIITNSMLAVTTFSLSIMVTAHLSADKGVTPRSHRLLQEDGRTQTVLATFVGTFIYALALTVIMNTGLLEEADYALIYLVTVGVIGFIVIAIMRWIAHLDGLGSVEMTSRRVEDQAGNCIDAQNAAPLLGAHALLDPDAQIPAGAHAIHADTFGYVQNIDTAHLSRRMTEWGGRVFVPVRPGDWASAGDTLAFADVADFDDAREAEIRGAISVGDVRVWDQDTGFGLVVLTEIAERALSPGINDPRTGIDIVTRLTRLYHRLAPEREGGEPSAPHVYVAPLDTAETLLCTVDRIARDGRAFVEVQIACQRCYASLAGHRDADLAAQARHLSRRALAYAEDGLMIEEDLRRVAAAAPATKPVATTDWEDGESAISTFGEKERGQFRDRS